MPRIGRGRWPVARHNREHLARLGLGAGPVHCMRTRSAPQTARTASPWRPRHRAAHGPPGGLAGRPCAVGPAERRQARPPRGCPAHAADPVLGPAAGTGPRPKGGWAAVRRASPALVAHGPGAQGRPAWPPRRPCPGRTVSGNAQGALAMCASGAHGSRRAVGRPFGHRAAPVPRVPGAHNLEHLARNVQFRRGPRRHAAQDSGRHQPPKRPRRAGAL